jgi:hypothetical protein
MASIPLPALDVRPPQQEPNLLSQYAQLQALKNQQIMQPLQQQAAEQQVQSGALELQQQKIKVKDQQAQQAMMQQWGPPKATAPASASAAGAGSPPPASSQAASSMPSYDDLVPLAIKNGMSFQGVQQIQQYVLQMKQQASTIAMNDARAGSSNAEAMKTKNGMITDAITGVMNAPDAQLSQAIQETAQHLSDAGLFDPQHVQMAQQLSQLAQTNPAQARQQLQLQANSLGGFSKLLENAQKQVALQQEKGKGDPSSPFYTPSATSVALGTAPLSAQIQAGEARAAGQKAGAEESARMPGEMRLAQQKQALSQGDPNAAGQLLVNGDATLSELKARGATPEFIQQTLQAAHQQSGGQYNAQQADAQFQVAKSPANVAFFGSAKSLTDKGGTLDQLAQTAKSIPANQLPVFNTVADWEKAATGSGPIAKYASQALGVADDYSKVMGGGQGSDTSRAQALKLIAAAQSPEQRAASIEGIRGAVGSQIAGRIGQNPVLKRMYGDNLAQPGAQPGQQAAPPQGATHIAPGSDGKMHYTDGKRDLGVVPQ